MKVLLIIPAYNEEQNLPNVVSEIKDFDYIIINDGSTDNTSDLPYNMINLRENHGVGFAMKIGYKYAYLNGYDYAIQIDGDGQHDVKYCDKLIKELESHDIVIGSRNMKEYRRKDNCPLRQLGIKIIRNRIFENTGVLVPDPTSGMRAVNRKVMKEFINNYPSVAAEPISLFRLIKKGFKVKSVTVKMRKRLKGKSFVNLRSALKYMFSIFFFIH